MTGERAVATFWRREEIRAPSDCLCLRSIPRFSKRCVISDLRCMWQLIRAMGVSTASGSAGRHAAGALLLTLAALGAPYLFVMSGYTLYES
jgi:hypothetical protein